MHVSDFTIPTGELKASASLRQAVMSMRATGVDCLPVTDGDHHVLGILTADAVAAATAGERCDPTRTRARRVMTTDCCHCYADDEVDAALRAMTQRHARRSVVLDRDEHPIGILALGDLPARDGHRSGIEAMMDCDRLEQSWIAAARAMLRRKGLAPDRRAGPRGLDVYLTRPTSPARVDHAAAAPSGSLLPVEVFIEAYLDYHG